MDNSFIHYNFFVGQSCTSLQKFLQSLMKKGNKKTAQKILGKTIFLLQKMQPFVSKDQIFDQALKNIQPVFEFKSSSRRHDSDDPGSKKIPKTRKFSYQMDLRIC